MNKRVIILGGGSAGFIAAISLKINCSGLDVCVIRSKELGIIGVGEGTTGFFPTYIHGRLRIDPGEFHRLAEPTWKLGIRFINWGPRRYFNYTFRPQVTAQFAALPRPTGDYCYDDFEYRDSASALMTHDKIFLRNVDGTPSIGADAAYHIENQKFVGFLESFANKLDVRIADDTVLEARQGEAGISTLLFKSGRVESGDLYVDCSGFASVLLGKALREPFVPFIRTLFCDRAVVGGWKRTNEPIQPYTVAEGMNAGWSWRIDHEHLINRGYVYSSAFISDEEAEGEFRSKNPQVQTTRVVKFITGRYQRAWVQNVVAIGNSCGFVEPLEATSLGVICDESDMLARSVIGCDFAPTATLRHQFNQRFVRRWDDIRDFLGIHYKFNTSFATEFWRECQENTELSDSSAELVAYFQENGPNLTHRDTILDPLSQFGLEGYWTLLIGQKIPYQRPYAPSLAEYYTWHRIQETLKSKAIAAFSVEEALAAIRSPDFSWPAQLYKQDTFRAPI
jgi:tryptophan halogenase